MKRVEIDPVVSFWVFNCDLLISKKNILWKYFDVHEPAGFMKAFEKR